MEKLGAPISSVEQFLLYIERFSLSSDLEIRLAANTFLDRLSGGEISIKESLTQDLLVHTQRMDVSKTATVFIPPSFPQKLTENTEKEEVVLEAIFDSLVHLGIYTGAVGILEQRKRGLLDKIKNKFIMPATAASPED
jgi:hypothetical protein